MGTCWFSGSKGQGNHIPRGASGRRREGKKGKDGANDSFVPFHVGPDLKLPEKEGRASVPFNIDQTRLNRLVLSGEGQFDEIRVGPTFESVIGAGTLTK